MLFTYVINQQMHLLKYAHTHMLFFFVTMFRPLLWPPPACLSKNTFHDFKHLSCYECRILSFGWFHGAWIVCAEVSERSVGSIYIGGVSRKNKWDEIARVFILVKVWLKIAWAIRKEEGMGERVCPTRAVFLNGRAAARHRALASIIPGRERFSWNL